MHDAAPFTSLPQRACETKGGNLTKFAHIGLIYALGDIFEMESVNYIELRAVTVSAREPLESLLQHGFELESESCTGVCKVLISAGKKD